MTAHSTDVAFARARQLGQDTLERLPFPMVRAAGIAVDRGLIQPRLRQQGHVERPLPNFDELRARLPESVLQALATHGGSDSVTRAVARFRAHADPTVFALLARGDLARRRRSLEVVGANLVEPGARAAILVHAHTGPLALPVLVPLARGARVSAFSFLTTELLAPYLRLLRLTLRGFDDEAYATIPAQSLFSPLLAERALLRGRHLVWQPDTKVAFRPESRTVSVRIFGREVRVSPLVHVLAQRTGAPVVLASARLIDRDAPRVARVTYRNVEVDTSQPAGAFMQTIYTAVEADLLENIDQWGLWWYAETALGLLS